MKTSRILVAASALAATAALSGCYVVPIDTRYPAPNAAAAYPVPAHPVPVSLQARLYPLNETAGKMGPLTALVVDSTDGRASFTLHYAGEALQGEASRVAADNPGFGSVYREVYGQGSMPKGQRGIASAASPRGIYVNCEYALGAPNRGTGACLFSNGAKYQLHFGS
jgi:hypothetical protein